MQPTYLPWMGYYALMDQVDVFVFLDSVQFAKRSWQQRNKIKTTNGEQWLTVPVVSKSLRDQRIDEVKIDYGSAFIKKHIGTIEMAYKKARYYTQYSDRIFAILNRNYPYLSELNVAIIEEIKDILGIEIEFIRSSSLACRGTKAELLADICQQLRADTYISPPGSQGYLEQSTAFQERGIRVKYNDYQHPVYEQLHGSFLPYMSIIDLFFNEGEKSLEIIRQGIMESRSKPTKMPDEGKAS